MFQLITENTQRSRACRECDSTTDRPVGHINKLLSRPSPIPLGSQFTQDLTQCANFGLCNSLCAGIALEEGEGSRPCWIGKHLSELGEDRKFAFRAIDAAGLRQN